MPGPINTYTYLKQTGNIYANVDDLDTVFGIAPKLVVDTELTGKQFASFPDIKTIESIFVNGDKYVKVTLSKKSDNFFGRNIFFLQDITTPGGNDVTVIKALMDDLNIKESYKAAGEIYSVDGIEYFKRNTYEPYINAFWVSSVSEITQYPFGAGVVDVRTINFKDGTSILVAN